jgi:TPP-dependent trihydroxycyclohexane-1,2-dione (THcHDO) dehydratase
MSTIRLTAAQALVRFLTAQRAAIDGVLCPLFVGAWTIFRHGNVAATSTHRCRRNSEDGIKIRF